jgi:hypothetical protein
MRPPAVHLRAPSPALLALPWDVPLAEWPDDVAHFHDLEVGPSRHVVRFLSLNSGPLYAVKELPARLARREYSVLRELEGRRLPSVEAVGLAERHDGEAIVVTEHLAHAWQYRRLFLRLGEAGRLHRGRLFDAMAGLLVELHAAGVYWGDCSLPNTLFRRDGQALQAFLVDAETSAVHPELSDGQRELDLEILVENVSGGLADIGAQLGLSDEAIEDDIEDALAVRDRYEALWDELRDRHVAPSDRRAVEARIRRVNELGFAVEELSLEPAGETDELRLHLTVAGRRFHAEALRRLTGLETGEGQAAILLGDLQAYGATLAARSQTPVPEREAAERWLREVLRPMLPLAHAALGERGDPIQAYCDLLEVRWLLSERAGTNVGDEAALMALAAREAPERSAAEMAPADLLPGESGAG